MTIQELIDSLRRLQVETGSLACLGCGHEHSCGIHGCAILREAADRLESEVKRHRNPRRVAVIGTGPDGCRMRYPSITAAARAVGVSPGSIATACVGGYRVSGYFWEREADSDA